MKKNILQFTILFALCLASIFSIAQNDLAMLASLSEKSIETDGKNEVLPKRLERKYKRDAARLALRMEASEDELRYGNIMIPRENIESIFNILSSVYFSDETAKSIARCNVHTFPNPSIDHCKIIFDRNVDWAEPLREGITETNSDEINDLLDEYDLIIETHERWTDDQDVIVIRSKEPINMAAISNEFYNVEGVVEVDLGIPEIGGNDINISRLDGGWQIVYTLTIGGAYSKEGSKKHVWTYKALDNGVITFISEIGDPIPAWMKCDLPKDINLANKG